MIQLTTHFEWLVSSTNVTLCLYFFRHPSCSQYLTVYNIPLSYKIYPVLNAGKKYLKKSGSSCPGLPYPTFDHRAIILQHQRLDKRLEHLVRCIFVCVNFISQLDSNSVSCGGGGGGGGEGVSCKRTPSRQAFCALCFGTIARPAGAHYNHCVCLSSIHPPVSS